MKINFIVVLPLLTLAASVSSAFAFALLEPCDQCHEHLTQVVDPSLSTTNSATLCMYEISVKTGDVEDAGTDSRISLTVSTNDDAGHELEIKNLKSWGHRIDTGRDCFRRGNLDRFIGKAECMPTVPCKMLLQSDGTGVGPGWYVSYVQVTQFGPGASIMDHKFTVDQWLAIQEGYNLYAYRDDCDGAALA